jgi:hypothetical protein
LFHTVNIGIGSAGEGLLKTYDDRLLRQGMQALVEKSDTFSFVEEEQELYTVKDLKERYK